MFDVKKSENKKKKKKNPKLKNSSAEVISAIWYPRFLYYNRVLVEAKVCTQCTQPVNSHTQRAL